MEHFVLMSIFTPENTVGKKNDPDKDLVQTRIAELENEMMVLSFFSVSVVSFRFFQYEKRETSTLGLPIYFKQ